MEFDVNNELKYMQRCLELAALGSGYVAPNPMVGAVIVVENRIIAEGYHRNYGEPHAEPNAINAVNDKELLKKCTLYVNLEPCSHFGKTPPCANLIVRSGIPRVVIGTLDPNPKVSGRGVNILREAGIEVIVGVLEKECNELNKRFFIFQREKRPFILLKWAQTQDGFIDRVRSSKAEQPLLISNELTRQITHKMRAENQAIMVSTNTVLLDNPSLTVRHWTGKSPIRIAIDRTGRIPDDYQIFDGKQPTIVFTSTNRAFPGVEFIQTTFDNDCLKSIIHSIYNQQIDSVLVEGGSKLLQSFITEGLWDEAHVEIGTTCIEDGVKAPKLAYSHEEQKMVQRHRLLRYINQKKQFT